MRQLTLISFPGVLKDARDPSTALAALGGVPAVRAATRQDGEEAALHLNLRPGDQSSASHIGAQIASSTGQFVLRVFGKPDDEEGGLRPVILGRVARAMHFPGLSDFQYVGDRALLAATARLDADTAPEPWAGAPDMAPTRGRRRADPVRASALRTAAAMRVLESVRSSAPKDTLAAIEALRPLRFVRAPTEMGSVMHWFRQHTGVGVGDNDPPVLGCDRRSDRARLTQLPHKVPVDVAEVPSAPAAVPTLSQAARSRDAQDALVAQLRVLFAARPVWTRRAVLAEVPEALRRNFKKAIPHVAFSFVGAGPFSAAWVRYGFDPRRDPATSRSLQVVELRCKNPVVLEAIRAQARDVQAAGPTQYDFFPADYTLAECPTRKNMFMQLCDIQLSKVQDLLRDEPFAETFSAKNGHFGPEGMQKIQLAMKEGLYALAEQKIGTERTKRLMLEYSLRKKRRRYAPRSVLDSNFHRTGPVSEEVRDQKRKARKVSLGRRPSTNAEDLENSTARKPVTSSGENTGQELVEAEEDEILPGPVPAEEIENDPDVDGEDENSSIDVIIEETVDNILPLPDGMLNTVEGFEIFGDGDEDLDESENDSDEDDDDDDDEVD